MTQGLRPSGLVAAVALAIVWMSPGPARADLVVVDSLEWSLATADTAHDGQVATWERRGGHHYFLTVVTPHPVNRLTPLVVYDAAALLGSADPESALRPGDRVIVIGQSSEDGHRMELKRIFHAGADRALARDGSEIVGLDAIAARIPGGDAARRWQPRAVLLPLERSNLETASLRVPADRETELLLRARLGDANLGRRAMAAAALEPFESSANIARLRALLDDLATFPGSETPVVCVWAARTLRVWEVPLPANACGGAIPDETPTAAARDAAASAPCTENRGGTPTAASESVPSAPPPTPPAEPWPPWGW